MDGPFVSLDILFNTVILLKKKVYEKEVQSFACHYKTSLADTSPQ